MLNYQRVKHGLLIQWPFQEPIAWRYIITIYKAYFSGLCKETYPQNMAIYGTVPPI